MNRRLTKSTFNRGSFFPLKVILAILGGIIDVPETDAEDRVLPPSAAERRTTAKELKSARADRPSQAHAPLPGSWIAATPYPINISRYGFAQVGHDLYVVSGFSGGGNTNVVNRYNATTNAWTPLANIPQGGQALSAAYYDGRIYATAGNAGPGFQIYDIATNTWSAGSPRPGVTDSYGSAAGAYVGNVFVVGGGTSGASTTLSIYNVSGNSWSAGPVAPAPYLLGGYTQIGQFLYCVGSFSATSPANNSSVCMRLDMSNNTWSTGPHLDAATRRLRASCRGHQAFRHRRR